MILAFLLACSGSTAPPAVDAPVSADPPALSSEVTGRVTADPEVTIDRCVNTSWSYLGCDVVFPVQGRIWLDWACRSPETEYREIVCARHAQYLIRGVGGPADFAGGVGVLQALCDGESEERHRACYRLAQELVYRDVAKARAVLPRGCDGSDQSPLGCDELAPLVEGIELTPLEVLTATGLADVAPGGTCTLAVAAIGPGTCTGRVFCGDLILYGGGGSTFPCAADPKQGGEGMSTSQDGDPAMLYDFTTGRVTVEDDAPDAAFRMEARVAR